MYLLRSILCSISFLNIVSSITSPPPLPLGASLFFATIIYCTSSYLVSSIITYPPPTLALHFVSSIIDIIIYVNVCCVVCCVHGDSIPVVAYSIEPDLAGFNERGNWCDINTAIDTALYIYGCVPIFGAFCLSYQMRKVRKQMNFFRMQVRSVYRSEFYLL